MNTATQITDGTFDSTEWKGDARLYVLDPPVTFSDGQTKHVVVSALDLEARRAEDFGLTMWDDILGIDRTAETLVFPTTPEGDVRDWVELALVDTMDHVAALAALGYEVVE